MAGAICLSLALVLSPSPALPQAWPHRFRLDSLRKAVQRDSNDALAYYRLGVEFREQGQRDSMETAFRTAVRIRPRYAEAYLALATLPPVPDLWRALPDSAVRQMKHDFRRAFYLDPLIDFGGLGHDYRDLKRLLMATNGVLGAPIWLNYYGVRPGPSGWMRDLSRAAGELQDGHADKAIKRLDRLLQDETFQGRIEFVPQPVLWYHAIAASRSGHHEVAIIDLKQILLRLALSRGPRGDVPIPLSTNDLRFALAGELELNGESDLAIEGYQTVLEFDLGVPEAHTRMARIYETEGRWEEALLERRRAVETNQEEADPLIDLAATLHAMGEPAEAAEALKRAATLNSRDPGIPFLQAELALEMSDTLLARECYGRFLELTPHRLVGQIAKARQQLEVLH